MWLLMLWWETKAKITKKITYCLNMIQIKMLNEFKVIFVSRNAAEGSESFQIWQFLLVQNRRKAILTLPGSCPALTSRVWMARREKRWVMMKMTSTDITTSLVKGQKSQPRSCGLNNHHLAGFESSHFNEVDILLLKFLRNSYKPCHTIGI